MQDEFYEAPAKEHYDDSFAICPYCKGTHQPEGEDYSEDEREVECDECGKKYRLHQIFNVSHKTIPDCELNGEAHEFDKRAGTAGAWEWCGKCDKIRRAPALQLPQDC